MLQVNVLVVEKAWAMVQLPAPGARVKNWYTGLASGQVPVAVKVAEAPTVVMPAGPADKPSPVQAVVVTAYATDVKTSHVPKLLLDVPVLLASRTQAATW